MKIRKNLFAALPIPQAVQEELLELESIFPGRKFSRNLHLTLFFIGSGMEADVFAAALDGVKGRAFDLNLSGLGTFGDRVLWAGLEPCPALNDLQDRVVKAMEGAGLAPEKRIWRPHISLCRLKSPLSAGERKLMAEIESRAGWLAQSFCLYESELLPGGAVHKVIKTYGLES